MDVLYYSEAVSSSSLKEEELKFLVNIISTLDVKAIFRATCFISDSIKEMKEQGYKFVFIHDGYFVEHHIMYFSYQKNFIQNLKKMFKLKGFL